MRAPLALIALLTIGQPAAAHWEYAIWGMTLDAVVAASGGAARALPDPRQRLAEDARMMYQAEAQLSEPGLDLDVAFAFDTVTGGLVCVSYAARSATQAPALRDWLIRRFGAPAQTARDPASGDMTITWRGTDNIDLLTSLGERPVVLQCARGT